MGGKTTDVGHEQMWGGTGGRGEEGGEVGFVHS